MSSTNPKKFQKIKVSVLTCDVGVTHQCGMRVWMFLKEFFCFKSGFVSSSVEFYGFGVSVGIMFSRQLDFSDYS